MVLWLAPIKAQRLYFNGYPVDSVMLESSSGYYHFDKKGTTTGKTDEYVIGFDKQTANYIVAQYVSILSKATFHPETFSEKFKHHREYEGKVVHDPALDSLLAAFSCRYKKPMAQNIGLSKEIFGNLANDAAIMRIAKKHRVAWQFKPKYSGKEENEALFFGCRNMDTLDYFLSSRFDTSGFAIVTDVWVTMDVHIVAGDRKFYFRSKYPNVFKQPWYELYEDKEKFPRSLLNFDINKYLFAILPPNFRRKEDIDIPVLVDEYIKWYLWRRGVIYSYH